MVRIQYRGIPGSVPSPVLSAGAGSITSQSTGTWYAFYLQRSRAGHGFASAAASITLAANESLTLEIPASAVPADPNNGTYVYEHVLMLSRSNDLGNAAIVASWPGYEVDEATLRSLPISIQLSEDDHFVLNGVVADQTELPANPVHGTRRQVTTYYDGSEINITLSGSIFYWNSLSAVWEVAKDQVFNPSVNSMLTAGGANEDISTLDISQVIFPKYTAAEGAVAPEVGFWIVNDTGATIEAGSRRIGSTISMGLDDISTLPAVVGGVILRFRGYVDTTTGTIDPNIDGDLMAGISYDAFDTPLPYPGPVRSLVLPKDLEPGQAYLLTVQATMKFSDFSGRRPYHGAIMKITPSLGTQPGIYFPGAALFGSMIFSGEGSRRILPGGAPLTAIAASGSGVIETSGGGYIFTEVPADQVYFIEASNSSQNVYLDISGGCVVDTTGQPPATAMRAVIGTDDGVGIIQLLASNVALSANTEAVQVDIVLPDSVRADYPDVIAGTEATLNAAYVVIYIYSTWANTTYRFREAIAPGQETFSFQCDNTVDIYTTVSPAAEPTPDPDFGPFKIQTTNATLAYPTASTIFPGGTYEIYCALEWENGVTRISHTSPPAIEESPLTYAQMQAALKYWAEAVVNVSDLRSLPVGSVVDGQTRRVLSTQSSWQYWVSSTGTDSNDEETEFAVTAGLAGGWTKDISNQIYEYEGKPPSTFGVIGDLAVDTTSPATGNVYRKGSNGLWSIIVNMRGPQGIARTFYLAELAFSHPTVGNTVDIQIQTGGEFAFSINQEIFVSDEANGYFGNYKVTARASLPSRITVEWLQGPFDEPPTSPTQYDSGSRITATGAEGATGRVFALTGADFTQPAVDTNVTVVLATEATDIFPRPSQLLITDQASLFGRYEVVSVLSATELEVKNISTTGAATAGTTMPTGMRIIPGGAKGDEGPAGTVSAGGALELIHSTTPASAVDRAKLYAVLEDFIRYVDSGGGLWELLRSPVARVTQYTGSATLQKTHGLRLEIDATETVSLTIPDNANVAIPVHSEYTGILLSDTTFEVLAAPNVTINAPNDVLSISTQWQGFMLVKRDLNLWWFSPLGGAISGEQVDSRIMYNFVLCGDGGDTRDRTLDYNGTYWVTVSYLDFEVNGGYATPFAFKSTDNRVTWTKHALPWEVGFNGSDFSELAVPISRLLWVANAGTAGEWFFLAADRGIRSADGEAWSYDNTGDFPVNYNGGDMATNGTDLIFIVDNNTATDPGYLAFYDGSLTPVDPLIQGAADGTAFAQQTITNGLSTPSGTYEVGYHAGLAQGAIDGAAAAEIDYLYGEFWGGDYASEWDYAATTELDTEDPDYFFKYPYWAGYVAGYSFQYGPSYDANYVKQVYAQLLGYIPSFVENSSEPMDYEYEDFYKSTDGGRTWGSPFTMPFPAGDGAKSLQCNRQGKWIACFADIPLADLYTINTEYVSGVYTSLDGVNWGAKTCDLASFPGYNDSIGDHEMESADWWDDTILAILSSGRILRSSDNGDNWTLITGTAMEGSLTTRYRIFAGGGLRWLVTQSDGNASSGTPLGWLSEDDGLTWTAVDYANSTDVFGVKQDQDPDPGNQYEPADGVLYVDVAVLTNKDSVEFPALPSAPANNDFSSATAIASLPFAGSGATAFATGEAGEPAHAGALGGADSKSVWYSYVAAATGDHRITIHADFISSIAIYTGASVGALTLVASNDEAASSTNTFTASLTSGTTYYIAVDGTAGAAGAFALSVEDEPTSINDLLSLAIDVTAVPYSTTVVTTNARGESGEPSHAGGGNGGTLSKSVWWTYTPPANGYLTVSLENSAFNTVLGIYRGAIVDNLTEVASNDDEFGFQSGILNFPVDANVPLAIAADGYNGETGTLEFSLDFTAAPVPSNNDFASPVVISAVPYSISTQNVGATGEVGEPRHVNAGRGDIGSRSLWWEYTPATTGKATITATSTANAFNPLIAVYTGASLGALTQEGTGYSQGGVYTASISGLLLNSGTTYRIVVDPNGGPGFATGDLDFSFDFTAVSVPANNDFVNAQSVSTPQTLSGINNILATGETGEPAHNGGLGAGGTASKSIWYVYTATGSGYLRVQCTGSGGFSPCPGIYTGAAVNALTDVGTPNGNNEAFATITNGTTYYIAIDGVAGATGFCDVDFSYFS